MKKLTSLLLAFALAFGLTGVVAPAKAAGFDPATRAEIRDLFEAKGVSVNWLGRGDGDMAWTDTITRAEVAELIARAEKLEVKGENPFSDLEVGAWYVKSVVACATNKTELGVYYFLGHEDGTFAPDAEITVAEVGILVARFATRGEVKDEVAPLSSLKGITTSAGLKDGVMRTNYTITSESPYLFAEPCEFDNYAYSCYESSCKIYYLEKSVTVKDNERFFIEGCLVIPEGKTLTLSGDGVLDVCCVTVKGKLIINSSYDEEVYSPRLKADKGVLVTNKGEYIIRGWTRKGTIKEGFVKLLKEGKMILEKTAKIKGLTDVDTAKLDGTITFEYKKLVKDSSKNWVGTINGSFVLDKFLTSVSDLNNALPNAHYVVKGTVQAPTLSLLGDLVDNSNKFYAEKGSVFKYTTGGTVIPYTVTIPFGLVWVDSTRVGVDTKQLATSPFAE